LDFADSYFDLVISINTLHNIKLPKLFNSLKEIERVGKSKFICVESYKNEEEQFNLHCWALTAESIIDIDSWKWMFNQSGYSGDYEFIYF
jgi:ubiquinone/menaquinone biosynthesis C-methylase UbiE